MAIFISYPWLAFAVGAMFAALWGWRRARSPAVASVAWICYGAYEYLMDARVLCSGECNIRVDLLLIYPALLIASVFSLWRAARRRRSP
jgi:hypothetical protein